MADNTTIPSAAAAYNPLASIFQQAAQFPQMQQQLESNQEQLKQQKLETQKQEFDVNAAKQKAAQDVAGSRIDALSQVVRSNPKLLASDQNVVREMSDAWQARYGIALPLAPDGSLPKSLYLPDISTMDPKTKQFVDKLPPGPAKSSILDHYSGTTPADYSAPPALSPEDVAKIQMNDAKIGHFSSEDDLNKHRAAYFDLTAKAKLTDANGRQTKDAAQAQEYLARAQKESAEAAGYAQHLQNETMRSQALFKAAQTRSGSAQLKALKDFRDSYKGLQANATSLEKQLSNARNETGFDPDNPPPSYTYALQQLDTVRSQIQEMSAGDIWAANAQETNAAYLTQAGTGISTGKPPTIENVGKPSVVERRQTSDGRTLEKLSDGTIRYAQ
jgi:hypothetical protein